MNNKNTLNLVLILQISLKKSLKSALTAAQQVTEITQTILQGKKYQNYFYFFSNQ